MISRAQIMERARRAALVGEPAVNDYSGWRRDAYTDGYGLGKSEREAQLKADSDAKRRPRPSPTAYRAAMDKATAALMADTPTEVKDAERRLNSAVELNIADVWAAIQEYVEKRVPGVRVTGVNVTSYQQIIFQINQTREGEQKMMYPVVHVLRNDHKEL